MEFSDSELLAYYDNWQDMHAEALERLEPGSDETVSVFWVRVKIVCIVCPFIAQCIDLI